MTEMATSKQFAGDISPSSGAHAEIPLGKPTENNAEPLATNLYVTINSSP